MRTLGIDRKRYRVLTDLFRKLGDRQEISVGSASFDMKTVLPIYCVMGALLSVLLVLARLSNAHPANGSLWPYLGIFLFVTVLFLFNFLLSEVSNLLVNPVEGLALAHQPVSGSTYLAAKLTHLLRFLVYGVAALNLIPAFVPVFVARKATLSIRWFYPLNHIIAALTVALVMALSMCCVFGLLIRLMPAGRLKEAAQALQLLPVVVLISIQVAENAGAGSGWIIDHVRPVIEGFLAGHGVDHGTSLWMILILAGIPAFMAVFAVRSLSVDYLSRVFSMVHGRSATAVKLRRSRIGECIALLSGGQESRAGFEFVRRMMVRDWEFKRHVIPTVPIMAGVLFVLARGISSPFAASFSAAHLIPHVFGTILLWIALFLTSGGHPNGIWIFQLAPERAFRPFVRGVYLCIWIAFVFAPHMSMLPLLVWLWGAADALLFTAFSAASTSFYLSLQLRLIDSLPFGRPPRPARSAVMMPLMLVITAAAAIAAGVQHLVIFRSPALVAAAAVTVGCAAFAITRHSLDYFDVAVRHSLTTLSGESTLLYKEAE